MPFFNPILFYNNIVAKNLKPYIVLKDNIILIQLIKKIFHGLRKPTRSFFKITFVWIKTKLSKNEVGCNVKLVARGKTLEYLQKNNMKVTYKDKTFQENYKHTV